MLGPRRLVAAVGSAHVASVRSPLTAPPVVPRTHDHQVRRRPRRSDPASPQSGRETAGTPSARGRRTTASGTSLSFATALGRCLMVAVTQWTGREAKALRLARRMSIQPAP
jgi:hypothetical protein